MLFLFYIPDYGFALGRSVHDKIEVSLILFSVKLENRSFKSAILWQKIDKSKLFIKCGPPTKKKINI